MSKSAVRILAALAVLAPAVALASPDSRLTLVTCAGWDASTRAYTANLVVTAQPDSGARSN